MNSNLKNFIEMCSYKKGDVIKYKAKNILDDWRYAIVAKDTGDSYIGIHIYNMSEVYNVPVNSKEVLKDSTATLIALANNYIVTSSLEEWIKEKKEYLKNQIDFHEKRMKETRRMLRSMKKELIHIDKDTRKKIFNYIKYSKNS